MNSKTINIVISLLMYLPTCAFIPLELYLVLIGLTLYLNQEFLKDYFLGLINFKVIDKNFTLLLILSLVSFVYRLVDYQQWDSIKDIYSFVYLFPFTYIIAKTLKGRDEIFKYIIYFCIIEVGFSLLEYYMGVSTLFSFHKNYRIYENYDLLYRTRTYGLSINSSVLSFKYIYALVFLNITSFSKNRTILIELVLLIGSILTFGRIALIVVFAYLLLRLLDSIFVRKSFNLKEQIPFILIVLFFSVNPTWTYNQFTRNNIKVTQNRMDSDAVQNLQSKETDDDFEALDLTKEVGLDKIDMSGRNEIWNTFLTFSKDNIHFGNKGKKLMVGKYHAHNSFLEFFASFGVYVFLFMLFIFVRNINKDNYVFILALGLLGIGQYLFFWGVSLFDILIYYIFFFYKKNEN